MFAVHRMTTLSSALVLLNSRMWARMASTCTGGVEEEKGVNHLEQSSAGETGNVEWCERMGGGREGIRGAPPLHSHTCSHLPAGPCYP